MNSAAEEAEVAAQASVPGEALALALAWTKLLHPHRRKLTMKIYNSALARLPKLYA